jgi:hypothetical protein
MGTSSLFLLNVIIAGGENDSEGAYGKSAELTGMFTEE